MCDEDFEPEKYTHLNTCLLGIYCHPVSRQYTGEYPRECRTHETSFKHVIGCTVLKERCTDLPKAPWMKPGHAYYIATISEFRTGMQGSHRPISWIFQDMIRFPVPVPLPTYCRPGQGPTPLDWTNNVHKQLLVLANSLRGLAASQ